MSLRSKSLKIVLSSPGQAHSFGLTKELYRQQMIERLFTCYPKGRLVRRGISGSNVTSSSLPWLITMGLNRMIQIRGFALAVEPVHKVLFDRFVGRRLPDCDVFIGIASACLVSGRRAKAKGALWICDRPNSHILTQDRVLHEEYKKQGVYWPGISKVIIDRELAEYEECDVILLASEFARKSFLSHGINNNKLWVIPYGVDLENFYPAQSEKSPYFDVLYVGQKGIRKGIYYLLKAFDELHIENKRLTLIGAPSQETNALLDAAAAKSEIRLIDSVSKEDLRTYMSASHVLVLPSIEDGFGLVVPEALACGCPVVVSDQAGAADVVTDAVNGFIFPSGDIAQLTRSLEQIACNPTPEKLRMNALATVSSLGGWDMYADRLIENIKGACHQ